MHATEPKRGPGRPRKNPIIETEDQTMTDTAAEGVTPRSPIRAGTERRVRKFKGDVSPDRFYIAPEMIPEGTTYEWKRETIRGMPDKVYDMQLREQGWLPVTADRHPDLRNPGVADHEAIRRDDCILMERPAYLTEEARSEDHARATGEVRANRAKLGETPVGQLDRAGGRLKHSVGPVTID